MKSSSVKHAFLGVHIPIKSSFLFYMNHSLRIFLLLTFILSNFSETRATGNYQVPAKARVAVATPVAVKTVIKGKKTQKKTKIKKAIKKDSVVVDIDPTMINPPLFNKNL